MRLNEEEVPKCHFETKSLYEARVKEMQEMLAKGMLEEFKQNPIYKK